MSGILGIVEVPGSTLRESDQGSRLPPATRRFGGNSLVEWIVRRVTDSIFLDRVIVLVDAGQAETILRFVPPDVRVVVGTQTDALGRFAAAVRKSDADQVVRVSLASPFVDPELIDRLVCTAAAHPGLDYIGFAAHRGGQAVLARLGVFAEWSRASAVLRADREALPPEDRNDVTRYICSRPDVFRLRLIPIPSQLDRDDVRLAVHVEEDWDHAQTIFEALGPESLNLQRIATLLDEQPVLRQRMARLNELERSSS